MPVTCTIMLIQLQQRYLTIASNISIAIIGASEGIFFIIFVSYNSGQRVTVYETFGIFSLKINKLNWYQLNI